MLLLVTQRSPGRRTRGRTVDTYQSCVPRYIAHHSRIVRDTTSLLEHILAEKQHPEMGYRSWLASPIGWAERTTAQSNCLVSLLNYCGLDDRSVPRSLLCFFLALLVSRAL